MTAREMGFKEAAELLEVHIERDIQATRELVFQAFLDPEHIRHWWAPGDMMPSKVKIDPRVGGDLTVVMTGPNGEEAQVTNRFVEITPHTRIVFDVIEMCTGGASHDGPTTRVEVTFEDIGGGTRVRLSHTGFIDAEIAGNYQGGWGSALEKLAVAIR